MDAATDGLNEARLADDVDELSADSLVDCSTTTSRQQSASSSSLSDYVIAESTSSSCSPHDGDSGNVDNAGSCMSVEHVVDDVVATTTTSTTTSVPLLEQLVSSPCEVVTPLPTSSASSPSMAASDADRQNSLNKSFLQKLESFVSSVGQVAAAPLPRPPLTGWIRRPVFPCRSSATASGNMTAAIRRSRPTELSPYPVSAFIPSQSDAEMSRPLDLSAKRMESPAFVDNTRSSLRKHVDLIQHGGPDQNGVEGRFVDVGEMQPSGSSSLACLERDFGEHSTILSQLGSARDRQRQAAMTSRRGRNVMMPGMTASRGSAGVRFCPPHVEDSHPPRSYISRHHPPVSDRTCVEGGKLDSRHPIAMALRCLQCGRTFFSLPELTLHMIQSAHYANLVCAAAAYNVDDDDDCIVTDAYNSHQSVNATGADHRSVQLSRGKSAVGDVRGGEDLCRRISDVRRRPDYLDATVSPARSLDDESVSETESLQSPASTGSPTSPPYENASDDDLTLMSHLLRLQPLLSRTVLNNSAAVPGHVDWMAAADQRRRQLNRGRSSKTLVDRSPTEESLPIDLRANGSRYIDSHLLQKHAYLTAPAKNSALASRPSSTGYLEKFLNDIRGYRKSLSAAVKRSASSRWYNGKHRTKRHRMSSSHRISSPDCYKTRSVLNGERSAVMSSAAPALSEACLLKHDDGIRGEIASGVKTSQEKQPSQRQETPDCGRRFSPKNVAVQPIVIDGSVANSPAPSVRGRDTDAPAATGRDFRRSDQSEYAARFGKYYRLAQELSNKSD